MLCWESLMPGMRMESKPGQGPISRVLCPWWHHKGQHIFAHYLSGIFFFFYNGSFMSVKHRRSCSQSGFKGQTNNISLPVSMFIMCSQCTLPINACFRRLSLIVLSCLQMRNREAKLWDRRSLNSSLGALSLGSASGWVLNQIRQSPSHWPTTFLKFPGPRPQTDTFVLTLYLRRRKSNISFSIQKTPTLNLL